MILILVLWGLLSLLLSSEAIKVISSKRQDYLPDKTGQVEIVNSSLFGLDDFTLCARFLTFQFISYSDSYQALLHYNGNWLLASYVSMPCDDRYNYCTHTSPDLCTQYSYLT